MVTFPAELIRALGAPVRAQDATPSGHQFEVIEADGWILRIDGDDVDAFDSRDAALAALESDIRFADGLLQKHPTAAAYREFAEPRWLDAASSEDLPSSIDGSQLRAEMIGEMARNVARAKTAILVDGGNVSEVHESVYNSAAKAAGWTFGACEVRAADGRPHLFLLVRLKAEVDRSVDAGELLFGSVAFIGESRDRYGDGDEIGAQLISYALTNTPFIDGLEPHAPRQRSDESKARIWRAITRSRRLMSDVEIPAGDVTANADTRTEETPAAPIEERAPDLDESPDEPAERMSDFESPEAMEAFAGDLMGQMRALFDAPDASPAELMERFSGSAEAFASALGDDPAEEEPNAGLDGGERAMVQAESIGLRAQLKSLTAQVETLTAERAAHAAEKHRRSMADHIASRYAAAKLAAPEGDDMGELLDLCDSVGDKWESLVERTLRAVNVPPQGTILAGGANMAPRPPADATEAIARCTADVIAEAKAEGRTIRRNDARSQGYARAKKNYADVFSGASDSE